MRIGISATKQLFHHFPEKHPIDIRTDDIEAFQHHLATVRKVSNSTLNQAVNAIRYYCMKVVGDPRRVTFIERPYLPSGRRGKKQNCHSCSARSK